jgi:uncharacterized protein
MKYISIIILAIAFVFTACEKKTDHSEYIEQLNVQRKDKDKRFKFTDTSPILPEKREEFKGLNYFPVEPSYKVDARYIPEEGIHIVQFNFTNGGIQEYLKIAELEFELEGEKHKLSAYQSSTHLRDPHLRNLLFIPFSDQTNGKETYGGGRYLDLDKPDSAGVILDFNLAYNPLCVYDPDYVCPLTPEENRLKIPIRAGEKNLK